MASVTIQITGVCTGGDHASIKLTKDNQSHTVPMLVTDLRGPISQDELEVFVRVALKLHAEGKTLAQFKTSASVGFTVIV